MAVYRQVECWKISEFGRGGLGQSLNINLKGIDDLIKLVNKRHDFVHRSGKNNQGEEVTTSKNEIEDLIEKIRKLCTDVDNQVSAIVLNGLI
tara:strand:- start:9 stop:284 length:276 start_codon:yes stop_codon:yes gene_type:complete